MAPTHQRGQHLPRKKKKHTHFHIATHSCFLETPHAVFRRHTRTIMLSASVTHGLSVSKVGRQAGSRQNMVDQLLRY